MATTIGVFDSQQDAERAVETLQQEGFSEEEISVIAKDDRAEQGTGAQSAGDGEVEMENISDGVAWGGGLGAAGGLLAGVGALAIPGIGPILAAGPLAAALSGAVAGGLGGGLIDLGIPEQRGKEYEQDVQQGRILCVVESAGDKTNDAARIMREAGAYDVETHGA